MKKMTLMMIKRSNKSIKRSKKWIKRSKKFKINQKVDWFWPFWIKIWPLLIKFDFFSIKIECFDLIQRVFNDFVAMMQLDSKNLDQKLD